MRRNIRVGAVDWRHAAWAGPFYPADLPEDWRLTFYASQFNCVFLPASAWRGADLAELRRWQDDVHDRFVFLLEGDADPALPAPLPDKMLRVDTQNPCICWFDAETGLKQLAEAIRADPDADIFLLSRDGNLGRMEQVGTLLELMGY